MGLLWAQNQTLLEKPVPDAVKDQLVSIDTNSHPYDFRDLLDFCDMGL